MSRLRDQKLCGLHFWWFTRIVLCFYRTKFSRWGDTVDLIRVISHFQNKLHDNWVKEPFRAATNTLLSEWSGDDLLIISVSFQAKSANKCVSKSFSRHCDCLSFDLFQLRPWLASYLTAASEEYFTWIRTSLDLFGATGLTRHQEADKTLIFPMWMRSHPSGDTFRLNRTNSSRLTRSDIRSGAISRRFILASLTCRLSLDCHSRLCSWLFGQIQKAPVFVWQCDRFRQGEPEMSKCHTFFSVHFFVSSGRDRTRRRASSSWQNTVAPLHSRRKTSPSCLLQMF